MTTKRVLRRKVRNLVEKVERIIQQLAASRTKSHLIDEILSNACLFEEADTRDYFTEPDYWRDPPISRRVH